MSRPRAAQPPDRAQVPQILSLTSSQCKWNLPPPQTQSAAHLDCALREISSPGNPAARTNPTISPAHVKFLNPWRCDSGRHSSQGVGRHGVAQLHHYHSFRRIKLGPQTQRLFEKWRLESSDTSPGVLVFPGRGGRPLWVGSFLQKRIQPIAKALGITVPVTFQVLRRSCTTRNQKHGTMKDVQAHMGHASIET